MTALAKVNGSFLVQPSSLNELWNVCKALSESSFVPKEFRGKPGDVFAAVQYGAELGISAMQSLQSIAPVNGRPSLWGDGLLGLILARPDCDDVDETFDEATQTATCTVTRLRQTLAGVKPRVTTRTFSLEDAKRAGLAGKDTYKSYPQRMLKARARGFALRDAFADVLKGIITREEAQDIPVAQVEAAAQVVQLPPTKALDATPRDPQLHKLDDTLVPCFHEKWCEGVWGGKPIEEAPIEVVAQYVADLAEKLQGTALTEKQRQVTEATHAEAEEIYLCLRAEAEMSAQQSPEDLAREAVQP